MVFEQNKDLLFGCHIVTIKIHFPDNLASKEDSTPQGFLPPTMVPCFDLDLVCAFVKLDIGE
jgi:hypothetical protein